MDKLTLSQVEFAAVVAEVAHAGQHYGELDYIEHLKDVSGVLRRYDIDDEVILVAGWLHDVVEDTKVGYKYIDKVFGPEVSDVVFRVTNELGKNRREKFQATSPKIAGHVRATTVKLADRIAHYENGLLRDGSKLSMYVKEQSMFRGALFFEDHQGHVSEMWRDIDKLYKQALALKGA